MKQSSMTFSAFFRSTDDLEVTRQSESSSSSDDLDLHKRKLKDNGIWPNLLKLSLTEVVASFQVMS